MAQCPVTFVPYQGACVRQCPLNQYDFLTENNQPRCVLKSDNTKKVNLIPVSSLPVVPNQPVPSMEILKTTDPSRYSLFNSESLRVDAEIANIQLQLDNASKINAAFVQLQSAENVRDQNPEAYQQARVSYYSLLRGSDWIETEKQRVARTEVQPEIDRYRANYNALKSRQENQQRTQDVMTAVQEGVLTMKDDFKYTTGVFKEQIDNLKNQINIERRGREKVEDGGVGFYRWFDLVLNLLIVLGLGYAVFLFWKKLKPPAQPAYAPLTVTS
jgi:hypothetical protein